MYYETLPTDKRKDNFCSSMGKVLRNYDCLAEIEHSYGTNTTGASYSEICKCLNRLNKMVLPRLLKLIFGSMYDL